MPAALSPAGGMAIAEYTAAVSAGLGSLGAYPMGGAPVSELAGVCHPHVSLEKVSLPIANLALRCMVETKYLLL